MLWMLKWHGSMLSLVSVFSTALYHFWLQISYDTSIQLDSIFWSLLSFTWVSWGYLPNTDILCRPRFCSFLPSFLCCYLFSKCNIHFFVLVFSDPTLFSLSFPVFYNPCLLLSTFLLCLSLLILYFLFLSFLSVTFFLAAFCLSPLTFFVYHLIFLSAFISFFPSLLSSSFICCLFSIPLTLLFILLFSCSSFLYFVPFNFLSAFSAYFFIFPFYFPYFAFFSLSLIILC